MSRPYQPRGAALRALILSRAATPEAIIAADRAQRQAEPAIEFSDPQVQIAYAILADSNATPPAGEHWEGFAARRIVSALRQAEQEPIGWKWMTHPSRHDGQPLPVRVFMDDDGVLAYQVFDTDAIEFEWAERDEEWAEATPQPVQVPLTEPSKLTREQWNNAYAAHIVLRAGWTMSDAEEMAGEADEFFNDDYAPEEAADEELSNWTD